MSCHDFESAFLPQAGWLYILSLSPPQHEPRAAKQGLDGLLLEAPHTPNHHIRMWGGKWIEQGKKTAKGGATIAKSKATKVYRQLGAKVNTEFGPAIKQKGERAKKERQLKAGGY